MMLLLPFPVPGSWFLVLTKLSLLSATKNVDEGKIVVHQLRKIVDDAFARIDYVIIINVNYVLTET